MVIELRLTPEGKYQARRRDGLPLSPDDRAEAKRMIEAMGPADATTVIDGDVKAVKIDSDFGPLWFAFEDDFISGDDFPVFFASEWPFLRQMGEDELRRRYEDKKALGGGWIRVRFEEPTKH